MMSASVDEVQSAVLSLSSVDPSPTMTVNVSASTIATQVTQPTNVFRAVRINDKCELLIPINLPSLSQPTIVVSAKPASAAAIETDVCGSADGDTKIVMMMSSPSSCNSSSCSSATDLSRGQVVRTRKRRERFIEDQKTFSCSFSDCGWSFPSVAKLRRHSLTHMDVKNVFVCDTARCGKVFTTIYNLNTHKKNCNDVVEVTCSEANCGATFQTQYKLQQHMQACHSQQSFSCHFPGCDRSFPSQLHLNSHLRVHRTDNESLSCKFPGCGRQFSHQCRLKAHERSCHSGERPFPCTMPDCTWSFKTSSKLQRHLRRHTGQRLWVCPVVVCGKSFTRLEHLRAHSAAHSSARPFTCSAEGCRMSFKSKSALCTHRKRHRNTSLVSQSEGCEVLDDLLSFGGPVEIMSCDPNNLITTDDEILEDLVSYNDKNSKNVIVTAAETSGSARTNFQKDELFHFRASKNKKLEKAMMSAELSSPLKPLVHKGDSFMTSAITSSQPASCEAALPDVMTFDDPDVGCFQVETQLLQDDLPSSEMYMNDDNAIENFYLKTDDVFYPGTTINLHDLE